MDEETVKEDKGKNLEDIRKEAQEKACPVQRTLYFIKEFIEGPMCSKCYPCSLGTGEAKIRLIGISQHLKDVGDADIQALKRIGSNMIEGSFCKKGKDTGKFIIEVLAGSEGEFVQHLSGICSIKECTGLIEYIIRPELCIMCGKCSDACQYSAVAGEKKQLYLSGYIPYEIRQKRCTKCGECIKVCPTGAIEVVTIQKEEFAGKE